MKTRYTTLQCLLLSTVASCAIVSTGCSKKETEPATPPPAAAAPAQQPTPPATPATTAPKADPLKSMVDTATKAAETSAAQVQEAAKPMAPAAPAETTAPASTSGAMSAAQTNLQAAAGDSAASLSTATTAGLQAQAQELLTRYSGELATIKTGALAVKNYVEQHPEILPDAAKAKYQQLNTLVPQLETMVGTLKDYKSADLTTLVPKLQSDFSLARSLYGDVRALLPDTL